MGNLIKSILDNKIKIIANFYLFASFTAITVFYSYDLRLTPFPLGYIFLIIFTVFCYIIFVTINHLLLRKIISHKSLLIVESVLVLTLIGITISFMSGNRLFVPIRFYS